MDVIFLTGHRKSGTSVFHKLFEGHPDLNVFPVDLSLFYGYFPSFVAQEPDTKARRARIDRILRRTTAALEGRVPAGGRATFSSDRFLARLHAALADEGLAQRSSVLQAMLYAFGESCGFPDKNAWVVKETSQAMFAKHFMEGEINARFINLLRDPRDNYAALKAGATYYEAMGEDELQTLASLINRARMDFLASQTVGKALGDRFYSLRFEDLCADTEASMRSLCDFCGIKFHETLLSPTFIGEAYTGNSHEGLDFRGLSSENVGRWPERISEFEAKVIEFWLRDVMTAQGYTFAHSAEQSAEAFASFYEWYNTRYFFSDPFAR